MGLMKRVLHHRLVNGIPLNIPVKFDRAIFGLDPLPQKSKKVKRKRETTALTDEQSRPDILQKAMADAESILGRKVTIEDLTGGRKNGGSNSVEDGDNRRGWEDDIIL